MGNKNDLREMLENLSQEEITSLEKTAITNIQ